MICPECDQETGVDEGHIGKWSCPQCRTYFILTVDDPTPRPLPPRRVHPITTSRIRPDRDTVPEPIEIQPDGTATYTCIKCGEPTPISHCMDTRTFKDRMVTVVKKASHTIGFRDPVDIYPVINGMIMHQTRWTPIIVQGPVCPRCC